MKMEKKVLRAQVKGSQPGHFTTCLACKAKITWAKDDRFPERNIGDLINVEPNPDKTGTIVLWYEITAKGKPIGPQWFREILEHLDYKGDRWSRHAETCLGKWGTDVRPL